MHPSDDAVIVEAFDALLRRLQPTDREARQVRRAARIVRKALKYRLGQSISRIIPFGSFAKKTGIRGRSDVDMLFVITPDQLFKPGEDAASSFVLLRRFRQALAKRFWSTRMRRDGQAISLRFRTGSAFDIVPAVLMRRHGVTNIYHIPDGRGGWFPTAPTAEHTRFRRANDRSRGKLGRTLQLLKLWRSCRSKPVPLRSYYVELLLSKSGIANGARSYAHLLSRSFRLLNQRQGKALRDPATRVPMTPMFGKRTNAQKIRTTLRNTHKQAAEAIRMARTGRTNDALKLWQKIFNGRFLTEFPSTRPEIKPGRPKEKSRIGTSRSKLNDRRVSKDPRGI